MNSARKLNQAVSQRQNHISYRRTFSSRSRRSASFSFSDSFSTTAAIALLLVANFLLLILILIFASVVTLLAVCDLPSLFSTACKDGWVNDMSRAGGQDLSNAPSHFHFTSSTSPAARINSSASTFTFATFAHSSSNSSDIYCCDSHP